MELALDFVNWLKNQVRDFAGKYTVADHRAFPAWAFTFLFDLDDDQAFNATDTLTQGDAGIDGWYFDTDNSVFHLIQAKYHESPESSVTSPDGLRALIHAALLLRDISAIATGPHHDRLSEVALSMQQALDDNFSISLDYIVAGRIGPNVRTEIETAVRNIGQNYTATFYDTERMQELWVSDEPIGDLSGETGDFLVSGAGEYYEKGKLEVPGVAKSAIVSLDGRSIAELVSKHGARLFQANVRYYLTKTNRVNKGMAKTLESLEGRSAFWLYNNGLTIVADDYEFIETANGTVLRASNPQIVNGAQTSSVLRDRRAMIEYGNVAVQTRIIATERSDLGRSALTNISEYTNSQSQVRISDLRANDERHKKIQRAFDSLKEPIFYERRRGEWQALEKAAQTKYAKRRMKKEDVGQRYLCYYGSPAAAVGDKDSIFGENENIAFSTSTPASLYAFAYELFAEADSLLLPVNEDRLRSLVPAFFSEGQPTSNLLALRRSRKLAAAHATALSKMVLEWRYSSVGEVRARELRNLLPPNSEASQFLWRQVFRSIWQWSLALSDLSELRGALQRNSTIGQMKGHLENYLVDFDRNSNPLPSIPPQ